MAVVTCTASQCLMCHLCYGIPRISERCVLRCLAYIARSTMLLVTGDTRTAVTQLKQALALVLDCCVFAGSQVAASVSCTRPYTCMITRGRSESAMEGSQRRTGWYQAQQLPCIVSWRQCVMLISHALRAVPTFAHALMLRPLE